MTSVLEALETQKVEMHYTMNLAKVFCFCFLSLKTKPLNLTGTPLKLSTPQRQPSNAIPGWTPSFLTSLMREWKQATPAPSRIRPRRGRKDHAPRQ
jgi:hypothetical protein